MEVFLKSDMDEIRLGTVEEVTGVIRSLRQGVGMSFGAIISDIVANMLPEENQVTFDIILR